MAETNYSYIAIGVGLIAIAFGGYYTFFMGCTNSVGVDKSAPAPVRAKKDKEPSEKPVSFEIKYFLIFKSYISLLVEIS